MNYLFNHPKRKRLRQKLRKESPKAEGILWNQLKGRQLNDLKFIRQYGIGSYVVDFYCPRLRLVIEADGPSHFKRSAEEYDKKRQSFIEQFNIHFLRFTNTDIYENLDGVIEEIIYVTEKLKGRE